MKQEAERTGKHRRLSSSHYKTLTQWFEKVALVLSLQRHFYEHAFSHKGLRAPKEPLSRVACDRKPAILHG
jgi:hypothetical protein